MIPPRGDVCLYKGYSEKTLPPTPPFFAVHGVFKKTN